VNLLDFQAKLQKYNFLFVLNAFFSVDSFFFLSGFLACLLLLFELKKGVEFTPSRIGFVYFHRIWRYDSPFVLSELTFASEYLQHIYSLSYSLPLSFNLQEVDLSGTGSLKVLLCVELLGGEISCTSITSGQWIRIVLDGHGILPTICSSF
jgi:hypothetical protein